MNRYISYLMMGMSFLFVTCQDTKDETKDPITEKDTYKLIGEEIPFETGMEWIAYYRDQPSGQGRTNLLTSYEVSDSQMLELLSSTDELVGVAFHYGIDESGQKHILVVPVDETLSLWTGAENRVIVDANTGAPISESVASAWANNYKAANPNSIWFHFFGANIFTDMAALPYFNSVAIEPAINILNLTPQLLLVVYNDGLLPFGRSQDTYGTVYDASNACPPCAAR